MTVEVLAPRLTTESCDGTSSNICVPILPTVE
jgi:hypothetical protein